MAAATQYIIRPSELHITAKCPGSLAMQNGLPDEENESTREGTAAHDAFAARFQGMKFEVGGIASNGVVFTQPILDAGDLFYRACMNRFKGEWIVEKSLPCEGIHPYCGGTPDARAYDAPKRHIFMGDLKYGHRYVDPFGNEQLLAYLLGYVDELGINGLEEQHTLVTLFIVQPRAYRPGGDVTQWQFVLSDARAYWNKLRDGVATALLPGAPCQAGPHCRDCRAKHNCIALQRESAAILASVYPAERFDLTPEQTGRELARLKWALDTIEVRVEGLSAQAEEMIRQGKAVPLWTLERSGSRTEWDPAKIKQAIGAAKLLGVDIVKEIKPLTPTQAKAAGFDGNAFGLTISKPGSLKLKPFGANNPLNGVTQHGE